MAADLADVMDDLGVQLATVDGLRVFDFPPDSAQPPFAFVDMPDSIDYDLSYGRGQDRFTIRVFVGVATDSDRSARDALAAYAAGGSVKAAIEASTNYDYRVTQVTFGRIGLAAQSYAGAIFTVDVGG